MTKVPGHSDSQVDFHPWHVQLPQETDSPFYPNKPANQVKTQKERKTPGAADILAEQFSRHLPETGW